MQFSRHSSSRRIMIGLCLGVFFINHAFASESCTITSGPSPLLAQYVENIRNQVSEIESSSLANACGGTSRQSPVAVASRANDLIDQVKLDFPSWSGIGSDFTLNILTVMEGEDTTYATRDSKIFSRIENNVLAPAIKNLATRCQLTELNATKLAELLRINTTLESIFKETAAGNIPANPSYGDYTLPSSYLDLYSEIVSTYSPDMISASCKSDDGEDMGAKIKKAMDSLLNRIQGEGKGNEDVLKDWKIALDLMKGGKSMGETKYNEYQKKLLVAEYARQGIGATAIDAMVGRFTCIKNAEKGEQDINERIKLRAKCFEINKTISITGLDTIFKSKPKPTTTDQYLANLRDEQVAVDRTLDMASLYNTLSSAFAETEDNATALMENLGQIHINLTVINLAIEKRIPMMEKNCMKQIPSIVGACLGN